MNLLFAKARLLFGEQDWSPWEWVAREYDVSVALAAPNSPSEQRHRGDDH